jgi:hypothetical protein
MSNPVREMADISVGGTPVVLQTHSIDSTHPLGKSYEAIRVSQQLVGSNSKAPGDIDAVTHGDLWYSFRNGRAGLTRHQENSSVRLRDISPLAGGDALRTSDFMGFDFEA